MEHKNSEALLFDKNIEYVYSEAKVLLNRYNKHNKLYSYLKVATATSSISILSDMRLLLRLVRNYLLLCGIAVRSCLVQRRTAEKSPATPTALCSSPPPFYAVPRPTKRVGNLTDFLFLVYNTFTVVVKVK